MMCHAYANMHGVIDVVLCPSIADMSGEGQYNVSCRLSSSSILLLCISTLYITRCGQIILGRACLTMRRNGGLKLCSEDQAEPHQLGQDAAWFPVNPLVCLVAPTKD
ncbi:hypothetical protein XENOCAPTIV_001215 [Xenoophorus captivus]|uniref:Uncharacterized protein n=2 Tax=Goodeidae TaxID=28758 RepID=A0ABV0QP96_9TELE